MQNTEHALSVKPAVFHDGGRDLSAEQRMEEQMLPLGAGALNCAIGPKNGPPLLLLHGVTRCWRDFSALLPALTDRWQVFIPDQRGHGRSPWQTPPYRVADFTADILALIESHVPSPPVLVGHSLGAMVAATVAAKLPRRVRGLVLEDPPGSTLAEGLHQSHFHLQFINLQMLLAAHRDAPSLIRELPALRVRRPSDGAVVSLHEIRDPDAIRFFAECLAQMDPAILTTLLERRWLEGLDWFGSLATIECPTLILRADPACGGMLAEAEASRIAASIPGCDRLDLPGIGHAIHASQPEQTLTILADFFKTNALLTPKTAP